MNARRFVLDIFAAAPDGALRLSQLLRGAEVLEIRPTAVRVALTRLVREGTLARVGRGRYRATRAGEGVATLVGRWREREALTRRWSGGLLAMSGPIDGDSARRVMGLAGLRPRWPDVAMWVRPANLVGGAGALRQTVASALDGSTPNGSWSVFSMQDCTTSDIEACRTAFTDALGVDYVTRAESLESERRELAAAPLAEAAARSFQVGGAAISQVLLDPLLPASWLDAGARRRWFAEVRRFDVAGRRVWDQLLGLEEARPRRGPAELTRLAEEALS